MRFAHLSDSHLGYMQFGLLERETDFYDVFEKNIDKIIEQDVDFVIHSGDLFDNIRPSTEALLAFQNALIRLNEAKIPIYAIAGNHDSILRQGALPPQVLFRDLGLKLIRTANHAYTEGGVLICGTPYTPSSYSMALKHAYGQLSKLADKYLKSILVSHQGIDKWMFEGTHEIELDEMPKNFDYYAMGHMHNYIVEDFGKGKLVYPGSMEILRISESNDNFRENGKGFVIVDLSQDTPQVERIKIDLPREFYQEIIEYKNLNEGIATLKNRIQSIDNKPMVDLTVVGGDFNSGEVYDLIQKAIGKEVLNLRPTFKPDSVLEDSREIEKAKNLDPRTLLDKKVNEKYGPEKAKLSLNLLDKLSYGKLEDAKIISDIYFKQNYYNEEKNTEEDIMNEEEDNSDVSSLNEIGSFHEDSLDSESLNHDDSLDSESLNHDDSLDSESINDDELDEKNEKSKQMSFDDF